MDVTLGIAAMTPFMGLAILARSSGPQGRSFARAASAVWAGSLLAFFAGVRRGLSFSESEGAHPEELATLLAVFSTGALTVALRSPRLGAAGMAMVGVLDALAAAKGEAPQYFRRFRPAQLGLGALALGSIAARRQR